LEKIETAGAEKLKSFSDEALKKGYTVIGLTASGETAKQKFKETYNLDFDWYLCDEKALKTVVRSNPGILEMNKGTVMQKVHWNDLDELKLPKVERKPEPKKVKENIAYFINGQPSTKEEVEALDKNKIDSVNVIKDSIALKELSEHHNTFYTGIIEIILKSD
jgi:hypothetical protein